MFELPEHGLPSLTSTGTATRRGELADYNKGQASVMVNGSMVYGFRGFLEKY